MTNTTTTPHDTHALIDIDECELLCAGSLSDAMAHIAEWNASEGTAYASVEQFNRGEEFYRIVSLPEPQHRRLFRRERRFCQSCP